MRAALNARATPALAPKARHVVMGLAPTCSGMRRTAEPAARLAIWREAASMASASARTKRCNFVTAWAAWIWGPVETTAAAALPRVPPARCATVARALARPDRPAVTVLASTPGQMRRAAGAAATLASLAKPASLVAAVATPADTRLAASLVSTSRQTRQIVERAATPAPPVRLAAMANAGVRVA